METVVSLFIAFSIFGTLLPAMQQMHESLELKRERVNAYETLHEAAKEMKQSGKVSGMRRVDTVLYEWKSAPELCVSYHTYQRQRETICADP